MKWNMDELVESLKGTKPVFEEEIAEQQRQLKEASISELFKAAFAMRTNLDGLIEALHQHCWVAKSYPSYGSKLVSDVGDVVQPGAVRNFFFGLPFSDPPLVPGLPETSRDHVGIQGIFAIQRFVVDAECAPHFDITLCMIGNRLLWSSDYAYIKAPVPASRFAPDAPVVPICRYIHPKILVTLTVKNNSSQPQEFKATMHGFERPANEL